jgi:hypothetical protein
MTIVSWLWSHIQAGFLLIILVNCWTFDDWLMLVKHKIRSYWTILMSLYLRYHFVASLIVRVSCRRVKHLLKVLPVRSLDCRLSYIFSTWMNLTMRSILVPWTSCLCRLTCKFSIHIEVLKQTKSHHLFSLVGRRHYEIVACYMMVSATLLFGTWQHDQWSFRWYRFGFCFSH